MIRIGGGRYSKCVAGQKISKPGWSPPGWELSTWVYSSRHDAAAIGRRIGDVRVERVDRRGQAARLGPHFAVDGFWGTATASGAS